jgi:uncharacterized protein
MTPTTAVRIVDAADQIMAPGSSALIHLYGGEPLTNLPAMAAMVDRAKNKPPGRFGFGITTNGTIDSDDVIELLGAGDFDISLSIDGPPEIHDACRRTPDGLPTHEKVIGFLAKVRERTRCTIRGSSVVRSGWRLADASRYLRELGVDSFKAQVVRVPPGSRFDLRPDDRQHYLEDLEKAAVGVINELRGHKIPADGRFTTRVMQLLAGVQDRLSFCDVGVGTFGVVPTGHVVPCVLIYPAEEILGHIDDDPATWLEAGLRWTQSRRLRNECRSCDNLALCGGGCPAIMPVCGRGECDFIRHECDLAKQLFAEFAERPEALLALVGIR